MNNEARAIAEILDRYANGKFTLAGAISRTSHEYAGYIARRADGTATYIRGMLVGQTGVPFHRWVIQSEKEEIIVQLEALLEKLKHGST